MDYSFDLSVRDVFESEVQTEMDQILRSGSVAYDSRTDTIDLTGYSPDDNDDLMGDFSTDMTDAGLQNSNIWLTENMGALPTPAAAMTTADITHFSSPEKFTLDGQGLLVDPQTGQPVSSLNLILGVSNEQQRQILLQQGPQQFDQHDRDLTAGDLESSTPNLNVSTSQQQQYLAFTPQQLQQSGLITGHFQTVPVLELQQQQPRQHQQQQTNPTPTHQSQAATLLSKHHKLEPVAGMEQKVYPKPAYSYSCLITMAMKNSKTGCMPVSDIYHFMCENFPYFKTAPDGWKNSVRHNLSLNKCFAKIEKPATANGSSRKGCLWALNPAKAAKMAEEVHKWTKKDPVGIRRSMANPENLERIEARVKENHVHPILNAKTTKSSTADIKTVVVKTVSATRTTPMSTATTTMTTVPVVNPKSHILDPVPISLYQAVDNGVFNGDINIVDQSLTSLDGDLSLPDHFMDPLNCEFMNLDVPITISPLPNNNNPMFGGLLEMSPVKDNQSLTTMGETTPCQYLQFCSPGRTPVTAFM